ncbi:MAG: type II toxin-antitoxin system RelE/ParE family toxin [Gammaproteobacteria bacterium]|jgi:hypothetical protein
MRILKTKWFHQWAKKTKLLDSRLKQAVAEIQEGQYEANLGGFLYKKRIALDGKGKRGGARTIVAFKRGDKAFFVYGFAKNAKANIAAHEKDIYKNLAKVLLSYDNKQIGYAIENKELIEVI